MNDLIWLVKREFWEHRGGFLWAPVVTGGVFLLLNLMGLVAGEVFRSRANINLNGINFSAFTSHMDAEDMERVGYLLDLTLLGPGTVIALVLFVVLFFYCVNTLADDRRDRSILFWKSLPISDRDTVLSKVASATVIAPLIAVLASIVCGVLVMLLMSITAAFHGVNLFDPIFTLSHPFRVLLTLIGIIPVSLVWALPTVGWLMLCSAAARSKPFLWALALPVGSGVIVSWFDLMNLFNLESGWFWQNIVGRALLSVFPASWAWADIIENSDELSNAGAREVFGNLFSLPHHYAQLATPEFLIGALVGIAMIAAAIWFRRWRTEM